MPGSDAGDNVSGRASAMEDEIGGEDGGGSDIVWSSSAAVE